MKRHISKLPPSQHRALVGESRSSFEDWQQETISVGFFDSVVYLPDTFDLFVYLAKHHDGDGIHPIDLRSIGQSFWMFRFYKYSVLLGLHK
ncbi:hypothetical protein PDIG_04060 [Penicillium digitatum PHI26]|uniref:Uncharacterized protein n=2 Tax=Penicillium digitatum TaxID=36651 RepID=K9H264_PEND2|nr:hypothetical protein PDIP_08730 [Penicillium digitatum Pd1]EKV19246.1 hypothetical protein PDIG_04060 [Penicillium digitatum PHI26]EKV21206.1 hypothetical protein PDIP_08730 [Penicillium digitatum Pd1]